MQLQLFFSKTVCGLPNWHVIWNIKWPDVSFGNAVINLLTLSATLKATSYITVMQRLLIESQFCASQGHWLQKVDTNVSRGEIFIISSSGFLALPAIPLCYSFSLSLSHLPIQGKTLKHSFIGTKKKKSGMIYASHIEWSYREKLFRMFRRNFRIFIGKVN